MDKIRINSIASLKEVLQRPGVGLILDRSTSLEHMLQRNPDAMRVASMPRTIEAVRSKDIIVLRGDGSKLHMDIPSRDNLITSDDESVTFVRKDSEGREWQNSYRVVDLSQPYEPSRLSANHPPLDPAVVAAEKAEKENLRAEKERRIETARTRMKELNAIEAPAPTFEYNTLAAAMKQAVTDALVAAKAEGKFLNNDRLEEAVKNSPVVQEAEYAEFVRGDDIVLNVEEIPVERLVITTEASVALAEMPRGAWRRIVNVDNDGAPLDRDFSSAIVSLGDGKTRDVVSHSGEITPEYLAARMLSHEVYEMRDAVEKVIQREASMARLAGINFEVGKTFKNIVIGRDTFSTATISDIKHAENGDVESVTLSLKKRGSRNLWTASMSPESLANRLPAPDPAQTPLFQPQTTPRPTTPTP